MRSFWLAKMSRARIAIFCAWLGRGDVEGGRPVARRHGALGREHVGLGTTMYIYRCIYTHVYIQSMYVHKNVSTYLYMCIYIYAHVYSYIYAYTYVRIHIYSIHACMYAYAYVYVQI